MSKAVPGVVVVWTGSSPALRVFRAPAVLGRSTLGPTSDDRISGEHVRVEHQGGRFTVTDLGSRNGTFVNGHPLVDRQVVVSAPSVLRTGRTVSIALDDVEPYEDAHVEVTDDVIVGARMVHRWRAVEKAAVRGQDVVIRGEPGVGKRRLAAAYVRRRTAVPEVVGEPDDGDRVLVAADYDRMSAVQQEQFWARAARRPDLCLVVTHSNAIAPHDVAFATRLARAVAIDVPPLRARIDELPHFIVAAGRETAHRLRMHATVVEACQLREWPGNITELTRAIEETCARVAQRGQGLFRGEDLPVEAGFESYLSSGHCRIITVRELDRIMREAARKREAAEVRARVVEDPRHQALREDVWRDPRADDVRAVYADCLLEHGDPRGELIALQLARASTGELAGEREQQLLEAHSHELAEPIASYLRPGFVIERGFVVACEVHDDLPIEAASHAAWSTVEDVETDNLALVTGGALVSARRLATGLSIAQLASAPHSLPYQVIVGRTTQTPADRIVNRGIRIDGTTVTPGALTYLRALSVSAGATAVAHLIETDLGRRLAHLDVVWDAGTDGDVAPLRELFERSKLQLLTVRCQRATTIFDEVIAFERGTGQLVLELASPDSDSERIFEHLMRLRRADSTIEVRDLVAPRDVALRHRVFIERLRTVFREVVPVPTPIPSLAP